MAVSVPKGVKHKVGKRKGVGRPPACEIASRLTCLLDTATEVFLEYGYEKTNIAEIAIRAGVSKQTIYSRYPAKADLFIAVIRRKIQEAQEIFARTLQSKEPLKTILLDCGMSLLDSMARPNLRALHDAVLVASAQFPELSSTFWQIGPKQCTLMLRNCLAKHPEFKGDDPDYAAEMFCSLCWGLSILKRQLMREDHSLSKRIQRHKVAEAVRIFLAAYA